MIKRVNKKVIMIIIILLLIGAYVFYKNANTYDEFVSESSIEEIITYEEEKNKTKQDENEELENVDNVEENRKNIKVHITGKIKNEGVIELEEGSRVIDAVNKAGGFTKEADSSKVNLAYVLTDGSKIYIPSKNEEDNNKVREYITTDSGENVITEEKEMPKKNNSLVNINEATQTELETLPGIGPSIALKIISYREEQGKFISIEDIKNVSGIGDNKFEKIKQLICV